MQPDGVMTTYYTKAWYIFDPNGRFRMMCALSKRLVDVLATCCVAIYYVLYLTDMTGV
jgi:hypothetical protein